MNESINDVEVNQSFRSPPRRRRSTFFDRRESLAPQPLSDNNDQNVCKQNTGACKNNEDLEKYLDKLLAEKDQWKKEVRMRRNNYHDLRQQYTMAAMAPGRSRMSYSALSNEDIEFLKSKANTSKLVEKVHEMHKSTNLLKAICTRAYELDSVILKCAEDKVNKITEHILENSSIDPTD